MLSLVNSGIRVVLIPAYARAIYHSQTATCTCTCKAVPASRLSVLCAERERSVLWLSRVSDPWSDQSMERTKGVVHPWVGQIRLKRNGFKTLFKS